MFGPELPPGRASEDTMTLNAFLDTAASNSKNTFDIDEYSLIDEDDYNIDLTDGAGAAEKDDEGNPVVTQIADTAKIALQLSQKVLDLYKSVEPYIS